MININDPLSILVFDYSDDYLFTYDIMFHTYSNKNKIIFVKTLEEMELNISSNRQYDIIISEAFFKKFNWKEIVATIENRNIDKNRIIFTSAFNTSNPLVEELKNQGYIYLEKPFTFKSLNFIINSIVNRKSYNC